MAIGASPGQIQTRILLETLNLAAVGILVGTAASWLASRALNGLLFGVTSADPITFVGMLLVITAVAIVSGFLPARRAARIDPVEAFRSS
jgi:ABC-type antimicrobial peptide transport system permease subunit